MTNLIRFSYKTLQSVIVLDKTHLVMLHVRNVRHFEIPHQYRWKRLSADDVRKFSDDPELGLDPNMATRLETERDYCFAVMFDDQPVSCAWFAIQSIEAEHNRGVHPNSGTAASFPSNTVFLYKGLTHPHHRGRGLYRSLPAFALASLADRGITQIISTADWTNDAALASFDASGFRGLGYVTRFGIGSWTAALFPTAARAHGIQLGKFECPAARASKAGSNSELTTAGAM